MPGTATPLVSVILPAYNAARFIRATIESVLRQTFSRFELIVVDDGSTDATAAIIAEAARYDPRIILLHQPNSGVAAARNRAIEHARGRYIAPIDADDLWFPEKLFKQVQAIERAQEGTGAIYAWSVRIDSSGNITHRKPRPELRGWLYPAFAYKNFCSASAPLIRRDCLVKVGAYDPSLRAQNAEGCEDLDLLLKLAEYFDFELVPEFLLGYRLWDGSMSCKVAAMDRSHRIVMRRVKQGTVQLPPRILRWSRSEFCLHLVTKCRQAVQPAGVWKYLLKAVWYDPGLLRTASTYRFAMEAALTATGVRRTAPVTHRPAQGRAHKRPGRRQRELLARVDYIRRYAEARGRMSAPLNETAGSSGGTATVGARTRMQTR